MAWAFFIIGAIILTASIKGKENVDELWKIAKSDFTGQNNFFYWVVAIVFIVALGNVKVLKPVTDAFLGLVILVIIIAQYRNGNDLFQEFITQVRNGTK